MKTAFILILGSLLSNLCLADTYCGQLIQSGTATAIVLNGGRSEVIALNRQVDVFVHNNLNNQVCLNGTGYHVPVAGFSNNQSTVLDRVMFFAYGIQ